MSTETTAGSTRSSDSLLRFAMRADAILSVLIAIGIAVAAPALSEITGIPRPVEYAIAVGFIALSVVVFVLAGRPRVKLAGIGIATANAFGAALTIAVLVADVLPVTTAGTALIAGNGVYMAIMAGLQYLGVRRLEG